MTAPRLISPSGGCSGKRCLPSRRCLQLRCLKAAVTCRGQCRKELGWGEEGGRQVYSNVLPEHSFTQPIYSKNGSMIYCKLKNNTKISHRLVTSSPDHCNTDRSNSVAELDPVSFMSTHCYRHSFRELLVKQQPQISTLEAGRRLGKQTQRHLGVQGAEWRCNLSLKVSGLFLPTLFSVVRDVSLADEGRSCSSVLVPPGWRLCVSHGHCSWLAIWQP